MKHARTAPPSLERLEGRVCPAITITYLANVLKITGTPESTAEPLKVQQVGGAGDNLFRVFDGVKNLGTYRVTRDLTIDLDRRRVDVEVDLNGGFLPRNLTVSLGDGYTPAGTSTVALYSTAAGGRVGGSVKILDGNGRETIAVGASGGDLLPVSIGGDLLVEARAASNSFGDTLTLHGDELPGLGSLVGGRLKAVNVDKVTIGDQNAEGTAGVAGNLVIDLEGPHRGLATNIFGLVVGNVTVDVSSRTSGFNQFTLDSQTLTTPAVIGGNLTVKLGQTGSLGNLFTLGSSALATQSVVAGNVKLESFSNARGAGGDSFLLNAVVGGSATLDMGGGTNFLDGDAGVVGGNLRVTAGDGDNFIGTLGLAGFDIEVAGNVWFHLGNGDNTAILTNPAGKKLFWESGCGDDSLTLGSDATAADSHWRVMLDFGGGDDMLTLSALAPATQTLQGKISFGPGDDTFEQNDWVIVPPTKISF